MQKKIPSFILIVSVALSAFAQQPAGDIRMDIDKIYVVFKTHLDVGFTELGSKVIDKYNHEFIPGVLSLSESFAQEDTLRSIYPWTTGSWLIWNYLRSAGVSDRKRMTEAIERKDLFWHVMPFTLQTELCDSSFLSTALSISERLDEQFGRKTRAAKITDVPGVSRSIIPVFKRHGITLLHIGANPGAAVPRVPEVFRWRNTTGEEINVVYQSDYGKPFVIPGTKTAVLITFTHDNHGPHTRGQIERIYAEIRKDYPNATVVGASLNEVADEIDNISGCLPLVVEDIGDTWMYGVASEPRMIAELRQLLRLRNQWIRENKLLPQSGTDIEFCIPLLQIAEHTWGLDVKSFLRNYEIYEFDKHPDFSLSPTYLYIERSWDEKRKKILEAVSVLPPQLQREAMESLLQLIPEKPGSEGFTTIKNHTRPIDTGHFVVSFDNDTGAVNFLKDKTGGLVWSDENNPWGEFTYQNYNSGDFTRFISQYCPPQPAEWMVSDYGKPGLEKIDVTDGFINYKPVSVSSKKDEKGTTIWLDMQPVEENAPFGAPGRVCIRYFFPVSAPQIEVDVNWFDKHRNRIPEAAWFSVMPSMPNTGIAVEKMNSPTDITRVVGNGARRIHGTTGKVYYESGDQTATVESLDAPLVVFNNRNLLDFDDITAEPCRGMHFNLLNTLWGTNYPQWFGGDMKYRFIISFERSSK